MKRIKIVISTVPVEGECINWTTHKYFETFRINKYLPLGTLSLATNLSDEHDVVLLDPSSEGWTIKETIKRIESESPDVLGLSVVSRKVYPMMKILQRVNVPYKVVGGPHATNYAEQILRFGADAVFRGQLTDLEFNDAMKTLPKGIIDCESDINDIKYPNRNLIDVNYYYPKDYRLFKAENRLSMFSSIGCPNRCTFCNVQSKKVQYKKPEIVMDEINHLQSVGCKSVHILDDNFNINKKHLLGILDEMKKRRYDMEWSGRGQTKMDLSIIPKMTERGFKRIHVGIEALDDDILRFFNKNERYKDVQEFCKVMNQNDVEVLGYFILGSPMETHEYRKNLPDRIKELGITHPFINILYPEPNTEYYRQLLREGLYNKDYWREFMDNPTKDYVLPYPYGKERQDEVWNDVNDIVDEFK